MTAYTARRAARSEPVLLNGLEHGIHHWGPEHGRPVVLLHGWMDAGLTWQFLADAFPEERHLVALDWRGFGRSRHAPAGYWFPDYLADLDALLDALGDDEAVDLVGHSMGGNVAGLYAGIRPERVHRLVLLEGFGMAARSASEAPERYRHWLDQLRTPPALPAATNEAGLAARLRRRHPHLPEDRALFVAREWTRPSTAGERWFRGDPRHKVVNPVLYRLEEAEACWRRVTAPSLWVVGDASEAITRLGGEVEFERRRALFPDTRVVRIADAGHMLHHDQPAAVAAAVGDFLAEAR